MSEQTPDTNTNLSDGQDPSMEDYGITVSIGNHWFGNQGISIGADWIGYSQVLKKNKEINGITNGSLTLLNLDVGYSF